MKTLLSSHAAFGTGLLLLCGGCASVISGRHAEVTIDSVPSNAHVVVRDKRGREVANAITPATVALKRKDKWIMPARYTATIEAPGYEPIDVPIKSTVNPWVLGNVVIGGIPGLIVDNATGAAWMPRNSEIHQQLAPQYATQQVASPGLQSSGPPLQAAQQPNNAGQPPGATTNRFY
jgi:hypothetical protein